MRAENVKCLAEKQYLGLVETLLLACLPQHLVQTFLGCSNNGHHSTSRESELMELSHSPVHLD